MKNMTKEVVEKMTTNKASDARYGMLKKSMKNMIPKVPVMTTRKIETF